MCNLLETGVQKPESEPETEVQKPEAEVEEIKETKVHKENLEVSSKCEHTIYKDHNLIKNNSNCEPLSKYV